MLEAGLVCAHDVAKSVAGDRKTKPDGASENQGDKTKAAKAEETKADEKVSKEGR